MQVLAKNKGYSFRKLCFGYPEDMWYQEQMSMLIADINNQN